MSPHRVGVVITVHLDGKLQSKSSTYYWSSSQEQSVRLLCQSDTTSDWRQKKKRFIFFFSRLSSWTPRPSELTVSISREPRVCYLCIAPPPLTSPSRYRSHLNDRYKWSLCVSHGKNFSKVKSVKPKSSLSSRASPAGVTNAELQQIHLESWNHFYGGVFFFFLWYRHL